MISGRLDSKIREPAASLGITTVIEKPFAPACWVFRAIACSNNGRLVMT
jgi:hypothetical protein